MKINSNISPDIIEILKQDLDYKWGNDQITAAGIGATALEQLVSLCKSVKGLIGSNDPNQQKTGYIQGTVLIYQLRSFLVGHDIDFMFGVTDKEGKLKKVVIQSQSKVLKNFSFSLRNMTSVLRKGLFSRVKKENTLYHNDDSNSVEISFINKLFELSGINLTAGVQYINGAESYHFRAKGFFETTRDRSEMEEYYPKITPDERSYVKYRTKNNKIYKIFYYKKDNGEYVNYNKGWVFEWGENYLVNINKNPEINNESLHMVMNLKWLKRESVSGIHGGDIKNKIVEKNKIISQFQQVKYENLNFMSANQIIETLNAIIGILAAEKKSKNQIIEEFRKIYIESNQVKEAINSSGDRIIKARVEQLLKTIKKT